MKTDNWETLLRHRTPGVVVHTAWFVPEGFAGKGTTIVIGLPECELAVSGVDGGGTPVCTFNRPTKNLDVIHWLNEACKIATENRAALIINCDTPEQVVDACRQVETLLSGFKRMPLERFYDSADRADKPTQ